MKLYIQWLKKNPENWVQIDSSDWNSLPQDLLFDISIQGLTFSNYDHYAIEEIVDGVKVYAWKNDGSGTIATILRIASDQNLGGAYNTRQTIVKYENAFPVPVGLYILPGKSNTKEKDDQKHYDARDQHGWREWTEGISAEFIIDGKIASQRDFGLYKKTSGTITYYQRGINGGGGAGDDADSDCTPAAGDNFKLTKTSTARVTASRTIPGMTVSEISFAFTTEINNPDRDVWPRGDYRAQIDIDSIVAANCTAQIELQRRTSGCGAGEVLGASTTWNTAGLKLYTASGITPDGESVSDRYQVRVITTNSHKKGKNFGIGIKGSDSFADGPWPLTTVTSDNQDARIIGGIVSSSGTNARLLGRTLYFRPAYTDNERIFNGDFDETPSLTGWTSDPDSYNLDTDKYCQPYYPDCPYATGDGCSWRTYDLDSPGWLTATNFYISSPNSAAIYLESGNAYAYLRSDGVTLPGGQTYKVSGEIYKEDNIGNAALIVVESGTFNTIAQTSYFSQSDDMQDNTRTWVSRTAEFYAATDTDVEVLLYANAIDSPIYDMATPCADHSHAGFDNVQIHDAVVIGSGEREARIVGFELDTDSRDSRIIGADSLGDSRDVRTIGYNIDSSYRNARILGVDTDSDQRDARLVGRNTDSSYRNARILGLSVNSDSRNAIVKGNDTQSSNRNVVIVGQNAQSDFRNASISGKDVGTNQRNARISGVDTQSATRNARIVGIESSSSSRGARISGSETDSSNRNARIISEVTDLSNRNARIAGELISSSERDAIIIGFDTDLDNRLSHIIGYESETDTRNARISSYSINTDTRNARIIGGELDSNSRDVRIVGYLSTSSSRDARIVGYSEDIELSSRNAKILGKDSGSSSRDSRIIGKESDSSSRDARIAGLTELESSISARITGLDLGSDSRDARIIGGVSVSDSRSALIKAKSSSGNSRDAIIKGREFGSDFRNSIIKGQLLPSSTRNARISGVSQASDSRSAVIKGESSESSSINARIIGYIAPSSSIGAIIKGKDTDSSGRFSRIVGGIGVSSSINAVLLANEILSSSRNVRLKGTAGELSRWRTIDNALEEYFESLFDNAGFTQVRLLRFYPRINSPTLRNLPIVCFERISNVREPLELGTSNYADNMLYYIDIFATTSSQRDEIVDIISREATNVYITLSTGTHSLYLVDNRKVRSGMSHRMYFAELTLEVIDEP